MLCSRSRGNYFRVGGENQINIEFFFLIEQTGQFSLSIILHKLIEKADHISEIGFSKYKIKI